MVLPEADIKEEEEEGGEEVELEEVAEEEGEEEDGDSDEGTVVRRDDADSLVDELLTDEET